MNMGCNCNGINRGMNSGNNNVPNNYPVNPLYFKEDLVCEILTIGEGMADVGAITDIIVDPVVRNIELIQTIEGTSNEGQNLTGYKVVIEINFREKILYVANQCDQPLQGAHFEVSKTFFIVPPEQVNGVSFCELYNQGRIQVYPYIEKVHGRILDCRTIQKCMLVFVNLVIL